MPPPPPHARYAVAEVAIRYVWFIGLGFSIHPSFPSWELLNETDTTGSIVIGFL